MASYILYIKRERELITNKEAREGTWEITAAILICSFSCCLLVLFLSLLSTTYHHIIFYTSNNNKKHKNLHSIPILACPLFGIRLSSFFGRASRNCASEINKSKIIKTQQKNITSNNVQSKNSISLVCDHGNGSCLQTDNVRCILNPGGQLLLTTTSGRRQS